MSNHEFAAGFNADALMADGFEEAFLGMAERCSKPALALYDARKCIAILVEQGMSDDEADEFFRFNTLGAWCGENTPLFLWTPEPVCMA